MALSASLGIQDASSEEENATMWTTFDCVVRNVLGVAIAVC